MTRFLPDSLQPRTHSIYGHPCSKFESWPLRGPKTLSPAGNHSITTGTGAELGCSRLRRLPRGSTAGSGAAPPAKSSVPEAFVSATPAPALRAYARGAGAPQRVASERPKWARKMDPLRAPQAPSGSSLPPTPHTTGKAQSRTHRPRRRVPRPNSSGDPLPAPPPSSA